MKILTISLFSILILTKIYSQDFTVKKINNSALAFYGNAGTVTAIKSENEVLLVDTFVSPKDAEYAREIIYQ